MCLHIYVTLLLLHIYIHCHTVVTYFHTVYTVILLLLLLLLYYYIVVTVALLYCDPDGILLALQVKVESKNDDMLRTACQQFMGKTEEEVKHVIHETLEGHQRAIMAHMTVEVRHSHCTIMSTLEPSRLT